MWWSKFLFSRINIFWVYIQEYYGIGSWGTSILHFLRKPTHSYCLYNYAVSSTRNGWGFLLHYILAILRCYLFYLSCLVNMMGTGWKYKVGLTCNIERTFLKCFSSMRVSCWKSTVQISTQFKTIICFLDDFKFFILDISPVSTTHSKKFSHSVLSQYVWMMFSFAIWKFLHFMGSCCYCWFECLCYQC